MNDGYIIDVTKLFNLIKQFMQFLFDIYDTVTFKVGDKSISFIWLLVGIIVMSGTVFDFIFGKSENFINFHDDDADEEIPDDDDDDDDDESRYMSHDEWIEERYGGDYDAFYDEFPALAPDDDD